MTENLSHSESCQILNLAHIYTAHCWQSNTAMQYAHKTESSGIFVCE